LVRQGRFPGEKNGFPPKVPPKMMGSPNDTVTTNTSTSTKRDDADYFTFHMGE
jgi:hypothetical protein